MEFNDILIEHEQFKGETYTPYAGKISGEWVEGTISIDYLTENFGHLGTADEMIKATNNEGLKLYFDWLNKKGILN